MRGTGKDLEIEILLRCSQVDVDVERVRELLNSSSGLDWEFILDVAGRNGVLPLVSWNLLCKLTECLNSDIRSRLSQFLQGHTQNCLHQSTKMINICEQLDGAGIPALPFKGPTLAVQAYGDIALRQFVDLDILVLPRDFDDAVNVLQAAGYEPLEHATWINRKIRFFTRKKDVGLISDNGRVRVELHWKLSGTHFAMPLEIDQLWKRLDKVVVGGRELRTLPFHDLFVYLCLHGSRHGWEKILWICDLCELITRTEKTRGRIHWNAVRQHARDHGCENAVELGLFLVHSFFGRSVDYPEVNRILNNEVYASIADRIRHTTLTTRDRTMQMREWYAYHLILKEKTTDRLRTRMIYLLWFLKVAVKPNRLDEAVFRLPWLFYPLYYVIRPIRLMFARWRKAG